MSKNSDIDHQYLEDKPLTQKEIYSIWINLALGIIFYGLITIIQMIIRPSVNTCLVLAALQMIISVGLTIHLKKQGTIAAIILNIFQSLIIAETLFIYNVTQPFPRIIFPICTIIIVIIIFSFENHLCKKIKEITHTNKHLTELNEKLAIAHGEVEQQNELLMAYNRIIKENEKVLSYQAFFDTLTDLPNRNVLIDRLELLISSTEKETGNFSVVFIDLDNFKQVNDTLGHHIGDLLLQSVSVKLKKSIHPDDMLGRLGGDEFGLIIKRPLHENDIFSYIKSLRLSLMEDIVLENNVLSVSASFGVAAYPHDGCNSIELLKNADRAMYTAKEYKKTGISFFGNKLPVEI